MQNFLEKLGRLKVLTKLFLRLTKEKRIYFKTYLQLVIDIITTTTTRVDLQWLSPFRRKHRIHETLAKR